MNMVMTVIVGAIIGFVASRMMRTDERMVVVANIIIGVVGSFLGGVIGGMVGIGSGVIVGSVAGAAGAAGLITILFKMGVLERLPV